MSSVRVPIPPLLRTVLSSSPANTDFYDKMPYFPSAKGRQMKIALFLACASCLFFLVPSSGSTQAPSVVDQIGTIAANSPCARVQWKQRGLAPAAYMRGMALVYARAVCHADRADVQVVSKARLAPGPTANKTDAL